MAQKHIDTRILFTIATGKMFASYADVQDGFEHLLGRSVWTHELAHKEIWDAARAALLSQHPDLPTDMIGFFDSRGLDYAAAKDAGAGPQAFEEAITSALGETLSVESGDGEFPFQPLPEGVEVLVAEVPDSAAQETSASG